MLADTHQHTRPLHTRSGLLNFLLCKSVSQKSAYENHAHTYSHRVSFERKYLSPCQTLHICKTKDHNEKLIRAHARACTSNGKCFYTKCSTCVTQDEKIEDEKIEDEKILRTRKSTNTPKRRTHLHSSEFNAPISGQQKVMLAKDKKVPCPDLRMRHPM